MSVLLFLNELSCSSPRRKEDVDGAMRQFVRLLNQIRGWRQDASLISAAHLTDMELAPGYYLREWAGRPGHLDLFRGIRRMQNRAPFSEVLPAGVGEGVDYYWQGHLARALGAAYLLDELLVSLLLDPAWDSPWIDAERVSLSDSADGDFVQDPVAVRHAATLAHSALHEDWIKQVGILDLNQGAEIWEGRLDLFPHLLFLPRVRAHMYGLKPEWVIPVARELRRIDDAVGAWEPERARQPHWRSLITAEAETRKRLCQFTDLDGAERTFDLHGRFTPGAGRIYFRLAPESRQARIAHIGLKLGI